MTNKKEPNLRFLGLTKDWYSSKFGGIIDRVSNTNNNSALPRIEYEDIISGQGTLRTGYEDKINTKKGIEFMPNDILFGKLRPYLKNWLYADFKGIAIGDFWVFRPKNTDGKFIYTIVQSDKFQKVANLSSGTKMPRSDWNTVSNTTFKIPEEIEEQQRIGEFFKNLDDRIALQQQHIALLKETKQGFLQKMFPRDGEHVPEVRFNGFRGEWEETKIGDIFEVTRGQVLAHNKIESEASSKSPYPVYSSQTKNNGLFGYYSNYLFNTAITWTTDGANAGTVKFRPGKFYSTNVNGVLLSDEGYANIAIAEIINKVAWKHVSKVGNPKLMNNVMKEITIKIPNQKEELYFLSEYIKKIDAYIEFNEKELELLQEIKKGFLQKMFV